ncbi:hypothetical protein KEM52_006110 [Ascosphaera acerosa]|nr:hypothetical protein KEM52_006110 [Ascosphaera acerosa]
MTDTTPEILTDDQILALLHEAEQRLAGGKRHGVKEKIGIPSLGTVKVEKPYVRVDGAVAKVEQPRLVSEKDKKLANHIRTVEPIPLDGEAKKKTKPTAGPEWFNLPKTHVTPELKRDLQLLRMRNVLDPHRHYKKDSAKSKIPEYSQVGTVVEGPTEFFSSRIVKRDRKKTFLEEVAADRTAKEKFTSKYEEIQARKRSGKKEHYKKVMKMRGKKGVRG